MNKNAINTAIDTSSKKEDEEALFEVISQLDNISDVNAFFKDLCTPQELKSFSERWKIARLLDEGNLSYRKISSQTGASTTTVGRVARFLNDEPYKGYRTSLNKISHTHHH
jgi:TrpR-related protein YerC/YecD